MLTYNSRLGTAALTWMLIVLSPAVISSQDAVDVTGKWQLEVRTDAAGTTTPTVTLKQNGEQLTGHYSSQTLGEADVTGSIKGRSIRWSFTADAGGMTIDVTYAGTVEGRDAMKGTISLAGVGEGTFTAKRM